MRRLRQRAGLTLIETLAVIGLISIAFAMLASGWSTADEAARLDGLAAEVLDLDRRARLAARRGKVTELRITGADSTAVELTAGAEVIGRVQAREGWSFAFDADGELDTVSFDTLGRSMDYDVVCRSPNASRRFAIAGLTGWVSEPAREVSP